MRDNWAAIMTMGAVLFVSVGAAIEYGAPVGMMVAGVLVLFDFFVGSVLEKRK